jgi:hypothetical protein
MAPPFVRPAPEASGKPGRPSSRRLQSEHGLSRGQCRAAGAELQECSDEASTHALTAREAVLPLPATKPDIPARAVVMARSGHA